MQTSCLAAILLAISAVAHGAAPGPRADLDTRPAAVAEPAAPRHAKRGYTITPTGIAPRRIGRRRDGRTRPEPGIVVDADKGRGSRVRTEDPAHRTPEGLGVGRTFGDFDRAYGTAEVEAATGRIAFPGGAQRYDITVSGMPARGHLEPARAARVLALAVSACPEEPE